MQPERQVEQQPDRYLVIQWKDRPDPGEPWWVHWYFDHVYLPFQRFSFKYFRIPSRKNVNVTADEHGRVTTTFSTFENGGVYDDLESADLACVDERDGYKPVPYNRCAPRDSAEYGPVIFPRSKNPRRWAKRSMTLVLKDRRQDEQEQRVLADYLRQLHQVLDR